MPSRSGSTPAELSHAYYKTEDNVDRKQTAIVSFPAPITQVTEPIRGSVTGDPRTTESYFSFPIFLVSPPPIAQIPVLEFENPPQRLMCVCCLGAR